MRPALVICGGPRPELADRLARAGFAVVSFELAGSTDLDVVLDALRRGSVGVAAEKYGLIGLDTGAAMALQRTARDERVRALVARPVLVDLRNVYEPGPMAKAGFEYHSVGR